MDAHPASQQPEQETSPLREMALFRLKWQFLVPLSHIRVLEFSEDDAPRWAALFPEDGSSAEHPIAREPLMDPPLACLNVVIDPIDTWDSWADADADDERPAPLVLRQSRGGDGAPITIGLFVREMHAYAERLRETLLEVMAPQDPEHVEFYFSGCLLDMEAGEGGGETPTMSVWLLNSEQQDVEDWRATAIQMVREGQILGS